MNAYRYNQTPVVYTLIAINIACFVLFSLSSLNLDRSLGLFFPKHEEYAIWQFITSMFMHGDVMHLLFNMLGLWMFGSMLESHWGSQRFVVFYFLAGLGAGIIYTLVNDYQFNGMFEQLTRAGLTSGEIQNILDTGRYTKGLVGISEEMLQQFYMLYHIPMVGASGAIYGILVAYAMCFPNSKMMFIFIPYPIAAKYFVPVILAIDLFSGMTGFSIFGGGVAHFAHIGGAVIGFLMVLYFGRGGNYVAR